jgi:hypothetical protein
MFFLVLDFCPIIEEGNNYYKRNHKVQTWLLGGACSREFDTSRQAKLRSLKWNGCITAHITRGASPHYMEYHVSP